METGEGERKGEETEEEEREGRRRRKNGGREEREGEGRKGREGERNVDQLLYTSSNVLLPQTQLQGLYTFLPPMVSIPQLLIINN